MTITRLAVANRGEIAARVFSTCRRLGIETAAMWEPDDYGLPFVQLADHHTQVGTRSLTDTRLAHLDPEMVLSAAQDLGADALHPGYGFLSENADFARLVEASDLTWIGPPSAAIELMGSKVRAKEAVRAAGVPVLDAPGSPTEADLPLLVKASAGGGGRGMRVVRRLDELDEAQELAGREALQAFGDATVFVEPYVEHGRHVEVQVLADQHGDVRALGTRDCSVQRRHQKVVEEAPAPGLPDDVRTAMHEAAAAAARSCGYVGAGTVEFLYDEPRERFFFLEMNTRLQVEHPVTEAVLGLDLVELQIAVAEGERLADLLPDELEPRGHAVEVRVYAEDPARDYQAQAGLLDRFDLPSDEHFASTRFGIRVDAGFETGSVVGTRYDAMLAKVVSWQPTRRQAVRSLVGALTQARIHGLTTNREQLLAILGDADFTAGRLSTSFLADRELELRAPHGGYVWAAAAMVLEGVRERRTVQRGAPLGWRNVYSQPQVVRLLPVGAEEPDDVEWTWTRDGTGFDVHGHPDHGTDINPVVDGSTVTIVNWGRSERFEVSVVEDRVHVDGPAGTASYVVLPRFVDPADVVAAGSLLAPMPGSVVDLRVSQGEQVTAGQVVVVLEAMKMQHTIKAPTDGVVAELPVALGQQVASGDVLAVIDEGNQS